MTLTLRSQEHISWEMAGIVSVERGLVATPGLPLSSRVRPRKAWVNEGYLYWDDADFESLFTPFDSQGMLDAFVRIQSEEDIPPFAVRFGTLQICTHGMPISHANRYERNWRHHYVDGVEVRADPHPGCLPDGRWIPEPVERWMDFVSAARSILNIAAAIHSGSAGRDEDWLLAFKAYQVDEEYLPQPGMWANTPRGLQDPTLLLSDLVNEWLRLGDVRPRLEWELGDPQIELETSAFGAIGVQLMQAVTRVHGLTLCSSCGRPYLRQGRKAPAGRRNYCPDCGEGAALRDAQRAHRERRRQQGGETKS
jgi:hypothetical protein